MAEALVSDPCEDFSFSEAPDISVSEYEPPSNSQQASFSQQSNRSSRSSYSNSLRRTEPLKSHHVLVFHELQDLSMIDPPERDGFALATPPFDKASASMYENTEEIGKYLMLRGFPLMGKGKSSLCFLLTKDLVAKVALIDYGHGPDGDAKAARHFYERNRDIAMHMDYPSTYVSSELRLVSDHRGLTYRLYVQERLYGPFTNYGIDIHALSRDDTEKPRIEMLSKMVRHNQDAKQFARTKRRRMCVPVEDDAGRECSETLILAEKEWLMCYDCV